MRQSHRRPRLWGNINIYITFKKVIVIIVYLKLTSYINNLQKLKIFNFR